MDRGCGLAARSGAGSDHAGQVLLGAVLAHSEDPDRAADGSAGLYLDGCPIHVDEWRQRSWLYPDPVRWLGEVHGFRSAARKKDRVGEEGRRSFRWIWAAFARDGSIGISGARVA